MAEIGGERLHPRLDRFSISIPALDGTDRKAMTEAVKAPSSLALDHEHAAQLAEGDVENRRRHRLPSIADEERYIARLRKESSPQITVSTELKRRRRMNRYQSGATLRLPHDDDALHEVDVIVAEPQRLARPHPRCCKQPEERPVCLWSQTDGGRECQCAAEQTLKASVGDDRRCPPQVAARQHARRGDLGPWIFRSAIAREATHHPQSVCPLKTLCVLRQRRELECELAREVARSTRLQKLDEPTEHENSCSITNPALCRSER